MASPVPLWRPVKADPARFFSPDEVDRARRYQRPKQRASQISGSASTAVLVAIVWGRFGPEFLSRADLAPWPVALVAVLAAAMFLAGLPAIPLDVWSTFVHEERWGFNTQTARGYVVEEIKEFLVYGVVLLSLIFLPIVAFIRATDLWWLWAAIAVSAVTFVLGVLWPIVVLPLFNKFTPLADEALRARLGALADRAGVNISEFLVMDASKKTRKDNAFFVGMGRTRRVVLYDNILELPHECIEVVVAHELGHWRKRHTFVGAVMTVVSLPALLAIVALITSWQPVLDWAGVTSLGDPAAAPLLLLVLGSVQALLSRGGAWMSRWLERQADLEALELTQAPGEFAETWRRMVDRNLPDLAPTWWKRTKMSHPPIAERMAFGEAWVAANPAPAPTPAPAT